MWIWIVVFILALTIIYSLLFISKVRDLFLTGGIYKQFLWLFIILVSSYFCLHAAQGWLDLGLKFNHSIIFSFLNTNIMEEANIKRELSLQGLIFRIVVALFGIILTGGLLISVFTNMLDRHVDRIREGLVTYRFKKHVLLVGYDDIAIGLIKQIEEKLKKRSRWARFCSYFSIYHKHCYLIQTTQDVQSVRNFLCKQLSAETIKYIYILNLTLDTYKDIEKLYPHQAQAIYVLGDKNKGNHDSEVVRITQLLRESRMLYSKHSAPLDCHVLFESQSTCSVFQHRDIAQSDDEKKTPYINILSFNFHELWAQKVFTTNRKDANGDKIYPNLDFEPILPDSKKQVHLVIVGMNSMGVSVAVQAMRIAHYANYKNRKTRITFVDPKVDPQKDILYSRYSSLMDAIDIYETDGSFSEGSMSNYTDIELEFVKDRIETNTCRSFLLGLVNNPDKLLTIAICSDTPDKALAMGLYLPDDVYNSHTKILINQKVYHSTFSSMGKNKVDKFRNVYPFGMINDCYDLDLNDDLYPKLINHVYWYTFEYDLKVSKHNQVDRAGLMSTWSNLLLLHKWSSKYNADHIPTKRRIRSALEQATTAYSTESIIDIIARVEHNRWVIERLIAGYKIATKEEIDNLFKLKEKYYQQELNYRNMLISLESMPEDSAEYVEITKKVEEINKTISAEWGKIKDDKNKIEANFRHDCLVAYDAMNMLDRYSDIAIARAIDWMDEQVEKVGRNSFS